MTVLCRFIIDADDFVLGRALHTTTTRIDLTQFVPIDEQLAPYFWKLHNGDIEAFEQSVRDDPAVESLINLDGRVNATLYQVVWTDEVNGLLEILRVHDILVEEANTLTGETWTFNIRAPDQETLSSFQSACYARDIRLNIRRVVHNPEGYHEGIMGVTEKQLEALSLALEEGYFEVPREITAGELAGLVGITRQSFSRRLQRAHKTITTNLLKGRMGNS